MPEIFPALYLSLKVALIATAVNLVLGTLAGYFLARKRFIGRELLDTMLMLLLLAGFARQAGHYWQMAGRHLRHQSDFHMARRGYRRRGGNVPADYQARPRRV